MISEIKEKINQTIIVRAAAEFKLAPTTIVCIDIETFGENKLPGDSPHYKNHGIAGIALGNSNGDACYIVVNDGRDYKGIPIAEAITMINAWLKKGVKVLLAHFSKFDLGFLLARGLDISGLILRDSWMIATIKSFGVYSSHKLKEIARNKLKVDTGSETIKDAAMAAAGTKDYGDVAPEVLAPYACNDVRLALLVLLCEEKLNDEEIAESRGICLNLPVLKAALEKIKAMLAEDRVKIKDLLGGAEIDIEDSQALLKYLHQKNLHPPPKDYMGSIQFVIDREYLWGTDHPLAVAVAGFDKRREFQKNFSALDGNMSPWVFATPDGSSAGFHTQHLLSVFSRGGLPLVKKPNLDGPVYLDNQTRSMFAPRQGYEFVVIKAVELPVQLLAFYCQNQKLQDAVKAKNLLPALCELLGMKKDDEDDADMISILLRQQIEGSGIAVLEQRMGYIKAKFKGKKTLYSVVDKFVAAFAGLKDLRERLTQALDASGSIKDRQGRVLKVEKNKYYRAHAILVNSSYGSLISYYLDMFCRLGAVQDAYLVLAHDKEMVFETPAGSTKFAEAASVLAHSRLVDPTPIWEITQGPAWQNKFLDSHEAGTKLL